MMERTVQPPSQADDPHLPVTVTEHLRDARVALASVEHFLRRAATGPEHDAREMAGGSEIQTALYDAEHAVNRLSKLVDANVLRAWRRRLGQSPDAVA